MGRNLTQRSGIDFHCLGEEDPLTAELEHEFRRLGSCSSWSSMLQAGKIFGLGAKLHLKHLPSAFEAKQFDGLVIDQISAAASVVAEQESLPYVTTCSALAIRRDSRLPPPPLPWNFRPDFWGRTRNRLAMKLISCLYRWLADMKQSSVDPLRLMLAQQKSRALIAQQPEFFDFSIDSPKMAVHYTAPWHQSDRDDGAIDFPWDRLDDRPLIYASMGTLQNNLTPVFEAMIEAVKSLPMQVVLSKGGGDFQFKQRLPANVLVVDRAPQLRLLEKASLVITHAGLNTVLECISHGIPMLCLPVTNDQPGVAKRVEWLGLGRVIPATQVTTRKLRRELECLLTTPAFQASACRYQGLLRKKNGFEEAADLVEHHLAAAGRPRRREPPGPRAVSREKCVARRSPWEFDTA